MILEGNSFKLIPFLKLKLVIYKHKCWIKEKYIKK